MAFQLRLPDLHVLPGRVLFFAALTPVEKGDADGGDEAGIAFVIGRGPQVDPPHVMIPQPEACRGQECRTHEPPLLSGQFHLFSKEAVLGPV